VDRSSRERRSLLRRLLGALGAALTLKTASNSGSTRESALQDATAGAARAVRGSGEAALPASKARAPAVAIIVVAAALCCCSLARAADGPPASTTPTSTTPDAPPPDPYKPPAPAAKPKSSAPRRSTPVVHSAPVVQRPTYSPPAAAPVAPVHRVQTRRALRAHPRKVVHKPRPHRHVTPHHVAPKPQPVKVTFNPFANLIASSTVLATAADNGDRGRYLWLAGLAFALLATAGLSLHVLSVRMVQ